MEATDGNIDVDAQLSTNGAVYTIASDRSQQEGVITVSECIKLLNAQKDIDPKSETRGEKTKTDTMLIVMSVVVLLMLIGLRIFPEPPGRIKAQARKKESDKAPNSAVQEDVDSSGASDNRDETSLASLALGLGVIALLGGERSLKKLHDDVTERLKQNVTEIKEPERQQDGEGDAMKDEKIIDDSKTSYWKPYAQEDSFI
ncbi:hypothetical protein LEN26_008662 [Aphanomyces euteiches]|nr:hypothetical protein LEN26_008662 [Aphanomyces euteiches]